MENSSSLHIEGWLTTDSDGMPSINDQKDGMSWNSSSIPREIQNWADRHDIGMNRDVKSGLGGYRSWIPDANIRIYTSDCECSLEEAESAFIALVFGGDIDTKIMKVGYSEYTITGYSLEDFTIGGHNLEYELNQHLGEYVHFIIEV